MKLTMTTVCSLSRPNLLHFHAQKTISSSSSFTPPLCNTLFHLQCHVNMFKSTSSLLLFNNKKQFINSRQIFRNSIICCVGEENETPAEDEVGVASAEQPVSVPVSPSDLLTMFFQAEGTMSEAAIPAVTSALQETEGISNLKVQVVEGIASVELMKQTTIQATGVASNLVETIQGSGFKLQTLNLSFEDEEEISPLVESNIYKEHDYVKTSAKAPIPPTEMNVRHRHHHHAPAEPPLHHSVKHHHHTHFSACTHIKSRSTNQLSIE